MKKTGPKIWRYHLFMVAVFVWIVCLLSCKQTELKDPFWDININADITTTNNKLYQASKEGEIINCVFSFDKEFIIKNNEFDAKVKSTLNHPKVVNKNLKIDYNLVVEFKNEVTQQFNQAFYNYIVSSMSKSYGDFQTLVNEPNEKIIVGNEIKGINTRITIIPEINLYMISITRRGKANL